MFTFIVCSIRLHQAEALKRNISETIGEDIPFEFIAYDNRGTGKGICQVYNECAERARYDNLCFLHEDVAFLTDNWGALIASKLSEPDCGVIGFAGSTIKTKAFTGWWSMTRHGLRCNYIQQDGNKEYTVQYNPRRESWSQVVTLDGLCLFARKNVWAKVRFDDKLLKGFHCYDVDFTIGTFAAGFKNWMCHKVMVKHFSCGNYDKVWAMENKKLHRKWESRLPLYVNPVGMFRKNLFEYRSSVDWMKILGKAGVYDWGSSRYLLGYLAVHPFNKRAYQLAKGYFRYHNNMKNK